MCGCADLHAEGNRVALKIAARNTCGFSIVTACCWAKDESVGKQASVLLHVLAWRGRTCKVPVSAEFPVTTCWLKIRKIIWD